MKFALSLPWRSIPVSKVAKLLTSFWQDLLVVLVSGRMEHGEDGCIRVPPIAVGEVAELVGFPRFATPIVSQLAGPDIPGRYN